jgi:Pyruvate/2-oxoacid:ferredoxin oxidoreductase delta subunit
MKRKIITIDANTCTGCGLCIPNCPEGAIQILDNKARLVGDLFCDGLGACLGHCPEGAISIEEREAEEYNEREVMQNIIKQGSNVIAAHLKHLRDHNQQAYVADAEAFLKENGLPVPGVQQVENGFHAHGGCPGSRARSFAPKQEVASIVTTTAASHLRQWPVQLHLVSPHADYFKGSDVVIAADCVAYALGDFHATWLKGKSLAIACPKLDDDKEEYVKKITALIDNAGINTLTVMIMEVPCCGGLMRLVMDAVAHATCKVPVKQVVVGIEGNIIQEQWM